MQNSAVNNKLQNFLVLASFFFQASFFGVKNVCVIIILVSLNILRDVRVDFNENLF